MRLLRESGGDIANSLALHTRCYLKECPPKANASTDFRCWRAFIMKINVGLVLFAIPFSRGMRDE